MAEVKVTTVKSGDIQQNITLNGQTVYLKRNTIVSPISGYVEKANINFGDKVEKNEVLFSIQSKERKALENTDILKGKEGIISVKSPSDGMVSELNVNASGGFVVEGTTLCSIVENSQLMVQVNVPFEYINLMKTGTKCSVSTANGKTFNGSVFRLLPLIDEINQTQNVLIKLNTTTQLPENLNVNVQFVSAKKNNRTLVPKNSVLTNETQDKYWVMKIFGNNLAVNIPISKGLVNDSIIEVVSGNLNLGDLIIVEGAYGLPDSTLVKIVK